MAVTRLRDWPPPPLEVADFIRVLHHYEPGGWWAESPDLEGWYAAAGNLIEILELSEEGIRWASPRPVQLEHFVIAGYALNFVP